MAHSFWEKKDSGIGELANRMRRMEGTKHRRDAADSDEELPPPPPPSFPADVDDDQHKCLPSPPSPIRRVSPQAPPGVKPVPGVPSSKSGDQSIKNKPQPHGRPRPNTLPYSTSGGRGVSKKLPSPGYTNSSLKGTPSPKSSPSTKSPTPKLYLSPKSPTNKFSSSPKSPSPKCPTPKFCPSPKSPSPKCSPSPKSPSPRSSCSPRASPSPRPSPSRQLSHGPTPNKYNRSPTSTNAGSINGQGRKPADINNPEVQAKIGNRATKRVNNHAARACDVCKKPLNDDGCLAFGKVFHKDCFKCTNCRKKLEGKFLSKGEDPYCAKCYKEMTCSACHKCGELVDGDGISTGSFDFVYHPACFICSACNVPIQGKFYTRDGEILCPDDAKKENITSQERCCVCEQKITQDCIVSNNKHYHPGCIKCHICGDPLKEQYYTFMGNPICEADYQNCKQTCATCNEEIDGTYYTIDGQVYCEKDYQDQMDGCQKCGEKVIGEHVDITGAVFHPSCFKCQICEKDMAGTSFFADDKKRVFCGPCYTKKFASICSVCKKPIVPKEGETSAPKLLALGKIFHLKCYKCEDCGRILDSTKNGKFHCYPIKNHVLCKNCNEIRQERTEEETDSEEDN